MQDDREESVRLRCPADMNDPGVLEFLREHVDDGFEHVVVQCTQCAVNEHPRRLSYQEPRECEAQLLVLAQFSIPSMGLVEQGRETFQSKPIKRPREGAIIEA